MEKDHTDDVDAPAEDIQLTDNDMLVDEYEQYKDGKADVVLVSPPDSLEEQEVEPLADDCMESLSPCPLICLTEVAAATVRRTPLAEHPPPHYL